MKRIAICDDNPSITEAIQKKLDKHYSSAVLIHSYSRAEDLLQDLEQDELFEVVIMDIVLEKANGISVAEQIRAWNPDIKFIFITGYTEYVSDVFVVEPVSLLLKPIDAKKLIEAVERAYDQIGRTRGDYFTIATRESVCKVPVGEILYLESEGRRLYIHSINNNYCLYMKIDEALKSLPGHFVRCHQSYLVNLEHVLQMENTRFILKGNREVPISRPKYKKTKELFYHYIGMNV